jgi:lysozyme family protein
MTAANYDEALRRLLVSEGGYTNHPADPGGPTNFGITIFDYRKYMKPNANAADVMAMPVEEAKAIYKTKYWDAQRCDELPSGVDYAVFDYGVNSGIGRAGKVLRRILNLVDTSSVVTDNVILAARNVPAGALISDICDERLRFLKSLKTWPVFGGGWGRRVTEVKLAALAMSQRQTPIEATQAQGKGVVPVAKTAQGGTAGGLIVTGTATAQHLHAGGMSLWVVAAIVVVTIIAGLVAWQIFNRKQATQQEARA